MTYLALLRGINVGGIRVPMPELKLAFERLGFANVKTYLQTGNVVFDAPGPAEALKPAIEDELSRTFAYQAYVLLYELAALGPIVRQYPFERTEEFHAYVVFIGSPDVFEEVIALAAGCDEPTAPGPGVLYHKVRRGETLETPLAKILAKKKYKEWTTTRNLNTLEKMLEG